jgi:hypothetical protein
MAEKTKVINRIKLLKGRNYQAYINSDTNELVLEEEIPKPEWIDITLQCVIQDRISKHGGIYSKLIHNSKCLAYFSPIKGVLKCMPNYKIELAEGAELSIKVYMKSIYID